PRPGSPPRKAQSRRWTAAAAIVWLVPWVQDTRKSNPRHEVIPMIEWRRQPRSVEKCPGMKILVIEDEKKTAAYLRKGLAENGFVVDVAGDGADGLHRARTEGYDLIILDVMLPEQDGWSVLTGLRQAGRQTLVLFLTAR